jgi:transmembrane sensor
MIREVLTAQVLEALDPRDAAALFVARRSEGLTAGEQQLFDAWIARDQQHRRLFESADRAWKAFDDSDNDEILQAMRAHALAPRAQSRSFWRPAIAAAAMLLLAVSGTWYWAPWKKESTTVDPAQLASVEFQTARGEVKELQLPDGSQMTLDADSAVVARFGSNTRAVQLQRGRAYFDVMPDTARPFTVNAGDRSIVVVGTRFDVNLVADRITVTLLEGRVDIAAEEPGTANVALQPGQRYDYRDGQGTVTDIGALAENALGWRTGLINFDDQPLSEAAAIMNRYSVDQLVINDPAVASLRVSGQFRAGDVQRFAATLADMHRLQAVRKNGQVELLRSNQTF